MRADPLPFCRRLLVLLALGCGVLSAQDPVSPALAADAEDAEVDEVDEVKLIAQRAALPSLTGENPFILRESSWAGEVEPGKARLIQVQLFKRNDYHFWLAVPDREAGVSLNLYNGKGELLETENPRYERPNVVGLVVSPAETGLYYLRLSLHSTVGQPQPWSVIYAYR